MGRSSVARIACHPLLKTSGKGYKPRTGAVVKCEGCRKDIYRHPFQLKTYKKVICSKECWKKISFSFNCKNCGKKVLTQPSQMKYRKRSACSRKCRYVLQKAKTLERRKTYTKHQLDRLARYSKEAIQWRKTVFERDDYTCQECHTRGSYLEADHIKPFAYFPELRYELSNGRTLCRPCHDKTKIGYKKMRNLYPLQSNV